MPRVIDFRVRPPYGGYQRFVEYITSEYVESFGLEYRGSLASKRYGDFVAELDTAGVVKAVVPGRVGFGYNIQNEELFELAALDPGRYLVFPLIEPLAPDAVEQVERLIVRGPGAGATFEPGIESPAWGTYALDDARVYPVYEALHAAGAPLLITYSADMLSVVDPDAVRAVDQVARDFPRLTIVLAHALYPWTTEAVIIAYRRPNVYLAPDAVAALKWPGGGVYREAARSILTDKIVFDSSYPVCGLTQLIDELRHGWGLTAHQAEKILYGNAARILGL